jgi:phage/plasmid primase-like uncharacterized protein
MRAIDDAGLMPPDIIHIDGAIHRFNSEDNKKNKKNGWYIVYSDGIYAGAFGDWKTGIRQTWCADIGRELTFQERMARDKRYMEAKSAAEAERKRMAETIAETAAVIWDGCGAALPDNPYLARKGVQPHGAKTTGDGRLVLPLYDKGKQLVTLQYISPDGKKLYHSGGPTGGMYWMIGMPGRTIYLVEGFATAASVHEATGEAVYMAYCAGNLINVASFIREKYGQTQDVVVVGDNDESGTGQREASRAAESIGARCIIPPVSGDANDYVQGGHDLLALLQPKTDDWLVSADEFSVRPAPIRWLVKKWIQSNALLMVHGPSGAGKSFVVLDWCLRIASGIDKWAGLNVRNGTVIYLAGEGHYGIKARIAAWKHFHNIEKTNMWLSRDGCELNMPHGYQMVVDHIRAIPNKPDLIVVDTLHRFLNGDENSSQDAGTMLNACNGLMKEFDCSVLLVHHTGVSEEAQHRARGSSAWRGALDVEISVVPGAENAPIQLIQRKQKDGELEEPVWLDLQSVSIPGWYDEDGEQVTSAVIVESAAPPKAQKDSKLAGFMKLFERAWFASGQETVGNRPYVSRKAMLDFLTNNDGNTEEAAKNMIKPSHMNRFIGCLINSQIIETAEEENGVGWRVCDNTFTSALLTMR